VELPERPGAREAAYRSASLDYPATERRFNCYYAEFLPVTSDKLRPHEHAGIEFIYVIQGTPSADFHNYSDIRLAMHPASLRCSSVKYTRHSPSLRLAIRAPRHPNTSP
jgi:hypothetical protein